MKRLPGKLIKAVRLFPALLLITTTLFYLFPKSHATALTFGYVRLDRMKAQAVATGGLVCVKPSQSHTTSISSINISFSNGDGATTGFTLSSTTGDWTATTSNLPASTSAFPGITSATISVSSQTVTYTLGSNQSLTGGTTYCFNFGAGLTPRTSAAASLTGIITVTDTTPANNETSSYAVATVTNDQINITASVPSIFTFSLGSSSASLGTLTANTVSSATGVSVNVGTNAASGYDIWMKGANNDGGGYSYLNSASTSAQINRVSSATVNGSPESLTSSNYGYVVDADLTTDSSTGSGTLSIAGEYNGTDTNSGGTVSSNFQPVASSTGTTDGDVVSLIVRARVNAAQSAATDYQETLTVVGSGKF